MTTAAAAATARGSTDTTTASSSMGSPPWEAGASSSLDRADGSAEDLITQMKEAGGSTSTTAGPGPNATFDTAAVPAAAPLGKGSPNTNAGAKGDDAKHPPPASSSSSSSSSSSTKSQQDADNDHTTTTTTIKEHRSTPVATANIKYKNEAGRAAILAVSTSVHHDFGTLTSILNVTLPAAAIPDLGSNPNVEWVDGNGAVYFVQPWRY